MTSYGPSKLREGAPGPYDVTALLPVTLIHSLGCKQKKLNQFEKIHPVIIEHSSSKLVIDAIALTRGDRFFTADFTPANLTAWGFQDCQHDTTNDEFGSMLGRRSYSAHSHMTIPRTAHSRGSRLCLKSFTLSGSAGYSVDLVGEVLNLIPVHFAATAIAGLPLKTETTPRGIYMEHELQQMLRDVFAYVFFEVEAAKKMRAEHFAGLHTQELLGYIKTNVKNIGQTEYCSDVIWARRSPA
ncbi:hypothetical protein BU17DRAFT_97881 [Hysterangium stoloniferum]|nr:hypothetical protein BU17DRAFT_97881 [Hysterangium stoloniferum]